MSKHSGGSSLVGCQGAQIHGHLALGVPVHPSWNWGQQQRCTRDALLFNRCCLSALHRLVAPTGTCGMQWACLTMTLLMLQGLLENWLLRCVPALSQEASSTWRRGWWKPHAGMPDAKSGTVKQSPLQKDEAKICPWYLFSLYSELKEEIPINCSNCVSVTWYLGTDTRL